MWPDSPTHALPGSPRSPHNLLVSFFYRTKRSQFQILSCPYIPVLRSAFFLEEGCATWHMTAWFPNQGSNPHPLCWKVLTTRPLGKSLARLLCPNRPRFSRKSSQITQTSGIPFPTISDGTSQSPFPDPSLGPEQLHQRHLEHVQNYRVPVTTLSIPETLLQ